MSGTDQPRVQPRATTPEGIRIEELARTLLAGILATSLAERREYGGIIHRHDRTRAIAATGPIPGYSGANVDIGIWDRTTRGCPPGTTPVAWYHTHPTATVETLDGPMDTLWQEFVGGDKLISDSFLLIGYVATMDRRFWRYDPPPPVMVEGKPVPSDGTGTYGPLNGMLRLPPTPVKPPRPANLPRSGR